MKRAYEVIAEDTTPFSDSGSVAKRFITSNDRIEAENAPAVHFPDEILTHIFSFALPSSFCSLQRVCKKWKVLSQMEQIWKHAVQKDIYLPYLAGAYIVNSDLERRYPKFSGHTKEMLRSVKVGQINTDSTRTLGL
eukprot:TRINITY_DN5991_c0_g1_i1.p1 TRINITY_DN5991_c0_g1~~TRINITY_DN5991_c0_g1_i1.p1  ORF type:complete len:136 (-),score=22.74 TRINITY_DN5991_c0_g1_i1:347-754(-)